MRSAVEIAAAGYVRADRGVEGVVAQRVDVFRSVLCCVSCGFQRFSIDSEGF